MIGVLVLGAAVAGIALATRRGGGSAPAIDEGHRLALRARIAECLRKKDAFTLTVQECDDAIAMARELGETTTERTFRRYANERWPAK